MARQVDAPHDLSRISPTGDDGQLRAVIESPQGSRNKLTYDAVLGAFELGASLPAGMSFPFDFGFIPGTRAADGDPLDVLVLMDAPAYPGVVVPVRILGVVQAEQREGSGRPYRNDRLIAMAIGSTQRGEIRQLKDLEDHLMDQIESFFVTYAALTDKKVKPLRRQGPRAARREIDRLLITRKRSKRRA